MNEELIYLRPIRAQVAALLTQLDARVQALTGGVITAEEVCPKCGSPDLAEAGDVLVCANCNENIPVGEKE